MTNSPITGLILAGGRGRRMGGIDKGLTLFNETALIDHAIATLDPQVSELLISANRNIEQYRGRGYPVLTDEQADFPGPLAGIHRGLERAKHDLVVVIPCDTPKLSATFVSRLLEVMPKDGAACIAYDGVRDQHLVCLLRRSVSDSLDQTLREQNYRVSDWIQSLDPVRCDFSGQAEMFLNINQLSASQL
ncbi:MAG TPA: molybdenum cofactor guanylyltransferase [Chromatiaceae bacterium]|jgi:molybdopterin-guanine dinucleotide biosynthesis protein A|nr:molybdenum cofactor guanylyltransferase [Chromatiaceae bacterium]HIB83461.1 molybdenum cofactor guanylyltransferase [Chromatiaceae bacterium]HIN82487.1 molybdenum cofactor guanylyltransferase [Chromatiales bacterium]HIO14253.1 molybdenum cofactor guanylyltransferase [Chromatiales bacterium]HIO54512.1 molybdenum cofactor guanylyltransferase [Chromatiales bacterium]